MKGASAERVYSFSYSRESRHGDNGDTLIEILLAIVVLGLTGVALLGGFASAIGGSADYRYLAVNDVVLKDFAESMIQQVQLASPPAFQPCASMSGTASSDSQISYGTPGHQVFLLYQPPQGYAVTVTSIEYFVNNSEFSSSVAACDPGQLQPQLVNAHVSGPGGANGSLSFVVSDPAYENYVPPS